MKTAVSRLIWGLIWSTLLCSCVPQASRVLSSESTLPRRTQGLYVPAGFASTSDFPKMRMMIEQSKINLLVIDVKDASGRVWLEQAKNVPLVSLAPERRLIDMPALKKFAQEHNIWLVARIVMFQDALMIKSRPEWAIRYKSGKTYLSDDISEVGPVGFLSPALKEVWDYNAQIAQVAAASGFNEVQLDYVRFPDEGQEQILVPGMKQAGRKPTEVIAHGVALMRAELSPTIALSVDVFGRTVLAADEAIGQDIRLLAPFVDYICPMLYPNLWTPGHFGLQDPPNNPYQVVSGSLQALKELLKDIPADPRIRPWLQVGQWNPPPNYGRKETQAQLRAAADEGVYDWTLWQSEGNYDPTAIVNFPR